MHSFLAWFCCEYINLSSIFHTFVLIVLIYNERR